MNITLCRCGPALQSLMSDNEVRTLLYGNLSQCKQEKSAPFSSEVGKLRKVELILHLNSEHHTPTLRYACTCVMFVITNRIRELHAHSW